MNPARGLAACPTGSAPPTQSERTKLPYHSPVADDLAVDGVADLERAGYGHEKHLHFSFYVFANSSFVCPAFLITSSSTVRATASRIAGSLMAITAALALVSVSYSWVYASTSSLIGNSDSVAAVCGA
jgi:hypothetical protein